MSQVDIAKAQADLVETERKIEILQGKAVELRSFLQIAERYQTGKPARKQIRQRKTATGGSKSTVAADLATGAQNGDGKSASAGKGNKAPGGWGKNLKRNEGNQQTRIARALVQHFQPGAILTAKDAGNQFPKSTIQERKGNSVAHQISAYLVRESRADNGVLEQAGRGQYRVRPDADARLQ